MRQVTSVILEVHLLLRETLGRVFEAAGITVLASHDDPTAFIAAVKQHRPQVAVVGVLLPETAGHVLLQLSQLDAPIPVVVLGAATNQGKVAECERLGAAAYLDRFKVGCDHVLTVVQAVAAGQPRAAAPVIPAPPEGRPDPLASLSDRELEVLALIGIGMVNRAIATALGISEHTVKVHVSRLYRKLGHHSRTELALLARDLGVTAPRLFG